MEMTKLYNEEKLVKTADELDPWTLGRQWKRFYRLKRRDEIRAANEKQVMGKEEEDEEIPEPTEEVEAEVSAADKKGDKKGEKKGGDKAKAAKPASEKAGEKVEKTEDKGKGGKGEKKK